MRMASCLHAGVRCGAGDVVLQLKSAWRDGTTHIKMSPLEFMQRLAALVPGAAEKPSEHAEAHAHASARMNWARLLKRVFGIDLEHCPQCGGDFKIIAAIEDPAVIAKILTHLCLPARAPPRAPARIALARSGSMASSRAVCSRCGSRKMPPRAKISRNTRTIDRSMVQG